MLGRFVVELPLCCSLRIGAWRTFRGGHLEQKVKGARIVSKSHRSEFYADSISGVVGGKKSSKKLTL